jgi:Rad3-related DNA helicase
MTILNINKIDETSLRVSSSDSGALMELSEHFTFYAEGYKFMPAVRNKMWDGKVRLYDSRTGRLPYGLLFDVLKFADSHGYSYELHPSITERDVPTSQSLLDYANSLHITGGGTRITPRDYQLGAYTHACTEGRSLVISPTGSGKSLIIYLCIRWFLEHYDQKVLIVVPTTSLVHQMTKDFEEYSKSDDTFNVEDSVSMIMSGYDKNPQKNKIKLTMEDGSIQSYFPNDIVNTSNRGKIKAGDLTLKDDIV